MTLSRSSAKSASADQREGVCCESNTKARELAEGAGSQGQSPLKNNEVPPWRPRQRTSGRACVAKATRKPGSSPLGAGSQGQSPLERNGARSAPVRPSPTRKVSRRLTFLWRWADSNRRPNIASKCFLHAYSVIGCRERTAGRHAILNLFSES